jgi:hypothetical protein
MMPTRCAELAISKLPPIEEIAAVALRRTLLRRRSRTRYLR